LSKGWYAIKDSVIIPAKSGEMSFSEQRGIFYVDGCGIYLNYNITTVRNNP